MKNIFIIIISLLFCFSFFAYAQNNTAGAERIGLTAYVPQPIEGMPDIAVSNLENKLSQIITANGFSGDYNQRFILTANISVLTKDITPTAPPQHAYTLAITLYIGDGVSGILFASTSTTAKGVGETETKAYINALKNLKTTSPEYQSFIETGKNKIIAYYNANCDFIIKEAAVLASTHSFEAAIARLASIPTASEECYFKAMDAIISVYQKYIDRDCQMKLQQATALWNASQDYESALQAGKVLASIEPDAECFKDVKLLFNKIETSIKQRDEREWKYILKTQMQESERIEAIRAIGVAYGTHQPNVVYNIRSWW
jgi:hypothetical protein